MKLGKVEWDLENNTVLPVSHFKLNMGFTTEELVVEDAPTQALDAPRLLDRMLAHKSYPCSKPGAVWLFVQMNLKKLKLGQTSFEVEVLIDHQF